MNRGAWQAILHGVERIGVTNTHTHGLSCSAACGIFPDQGLNPCHFYQQADSLPLRNQGSPLCGVFTVFYMWCHLIFI